MKIIDIYKSMKDLIRNILKEKVSTKSKELIYETESELDEQGRPRIYSDEDVLERACQYTNAREFKNSDDKNYYAAALRRGLMLKIRAKCKYTALGNLYSRMLYMYIWEKNVNAVYFGLTCDEDRRYNEHTKEESDILNKMDVGANCRIGSNSAVKDFIKKHGYHDRYIDISNGYVPAELAAYGEMCLIDHFRNDPEWKDKIIVVNRSKGGELGGRCFANARRMIQDVNLVLDNQFSTPEEFQQNYPEEFQYWSENKPRQKVFNQGIKKRFFPDAPYSKDEILSIAINYDDEDKFREGDINAYKAARRNKMLNILFPTDSVYYDLKNDKKYNSLKQVGDDLKVDFFDLFHDMNRGQGELDYGITLKPKNEINENILRRIIQEETDPKNHKKGIDIVVKMMSKSYPYIIGWKYNEELGETTVSIYIDIICDIEKTKEFFNSDLKDYYKRYEDDLKNDTFPYPFSPLEVSNKMDADEKFENYRDFRKEFNDLYGMLPEELVSLNRWNEPKNIDPDKYIFR